MPPVGNNTHTSGDLLQAVFDGDPGVVKAALDAGASVNGHSEQSYAPIVAATLTGDVDMVEFLLEQGADPENPLNITMAPGMPGTRPLQIAIGSGHVKIAHLLLEAGADPVSENKIGYTHLHGVALSGHVDVVDMLHSKAPSTLNRCASQGETPLFVACCNGHESVVSKLL
ncbi:unnamed protein product, partial [Laminaria digitata]